MFLDVATVKLTTVLLITEVEAVGYAITFSIFLKNAGSIATLVTDSRTASLCIANTLITVQTIDTSQS